MKNINLKELFKNKTTIYLSIVLGLLLVIGVFYAYFSITVNGNEEAKDITVTTGNLSLYYNSGPYYNRTSGYTELTCSKWHDTTRSKRSVCNYESNALTSEAKNQISSTKWYLGSVNYDRNEKCINTNWLFIGAWYWVVSLNSNHPGNAMFVNIYGNVDYTSSINYGNVRQSLYLNANVNYVSGDGTKSNPFVIN